MNGRAVVPVLLDLVALAAVTGFAWLLWPPACLLVLAGAALVISWRYS